MPNKKEEVYISVDIETAGPIPGKYSLLSLGACEIYAPSNTYYCEIKPVNRNAIPKALEVTGFSLDELERTGQAPEEAMKGFDDWLATVGSAEGKRIFVGFNAPFDWSFVNYYFHQYRGRNPFGFTALDIKALYMGATGGNWSDTWGVKMAKHLTPQLKGTHNALDDALYQAELFRLIRAEFSAAHP